MKLRKVKDDPAAMKLVKLGWIPMLQTGKITDSSGTEHDFTLERFKKIVDNYDPEFRKAPIVVGHPKSNGPAYGWIAKVCVAGNFLMGFPEKVQSKFKEWINTGALNTRSVSLQGDNLRHLGFLGAALPACPGLGDLNLSWEGITELFGEGDAVNFEASEEPTVDFAVTAEPGTPEWDLAWKFVTLSEIYRRQREKLIEDKGIDYANEYLPNYLIDQLAERPIPKPRNASNYTQGDQMTPEQIAAMQAENAQLKASKTPITLNGTVHHVPPEVATAFTANTTRITELETAATTAADAAWTKTRDDFVSGLVKTGQLLPAEVEGVKGMLDRDRTAGQGEFSEEKNTALKTTMDFLRKQPKKVQVKAVATPGSADAGKGGQSNQQQAKELARRATEFQETEAKAGRVVAFDTAVAHVKDQIAA